MGGWWGDMVGGKLRSPFFHYVLDSGRMCGL